MNDSITYSSSGSSGGVDTSGTPVANDIARFTDADTIEGLSYTEARSALNVADGADVTGSNAPQAHKTSHTDGSDDIRDATNALKGLATAAQITALEANTQSLVDTQVHGFVDNTETTISFSTYTFTLTDAGAGWSYYRDGVKYTISGDKTTTLAGTPPTTDTYYIYIDATDGTLTNSTTAWNLTDSKVPVAVVHFNDSLTPKYVMLDERHTSAMNKNQHHYEHDTYGTRLGSSGAISGYTLGSDVDINKQFDIAETKIWDEDLQTTLASITGGTDNYHIAYRTGASTWAWKQSAFPFDYTGSGYINYDNAGTMTEGANNKYYTTYLIATNQIGLARFTIIHGQSEFSNLTTAKAEQFSDLTLTGLDIAEGVAIWKFIWDTSSSYSSTGKCELDVAPIAVDTNITTQTTTPGLGTMSTQDADNVLITGGSISGVSALSLTPVTGSTTGFAAGFTGANLYGGTYVVSSDDGDLQLPLMAVGMNFTVITLGSVEVVAATNANDGYLMDGLTNAEGKNITNLSTSGDIAVFQYYTADDWLITTNGWTPEA